MRNRKKQREAKKQRSLEEKLDIHDSAGVLDPTPYYAVQNIIEREWKSADSNKEVA